jgi:hypothetical protein
MLQIVLNNTSVVSIVKYPTLPNSENQKMKVFGFEFHILLQLQIA